MVTWLKNCQYKVGLKVTYLVGLCLAVVMMVVSLIGMFQVSQGQYSNNPYVAQEFVKQAGYVRDWIVRYVDPVRLTKAGISDEDLAEYKASYGDDKDDETIKQEILTSRQAYYAEIKNELNRYDNIVYWAKNKKTGQVITNKESSLPDEQFIKEMKYADLYLLGNGSHILDTKHLTNPTAYMSYYYNGKGFDEAADYEIHIATKGFMQPGDLFYNEVALYSAKQNMEPVYQIIFVIALVIGGISFLLWCQTLGRCSKEDKVHLRQIDYMPLEILGSIWLVVGFFSTYYLEGLVFEKILGKYIPFIFSLDTSSQVILYLAIVGYVLLHMVFISSLIRQHKGKRLWHQSLSYRLARYIKEQIVIKRLGSVGILILILACLFLEWFLIVLMGMFSYSILVIVPTAIFIIFNLAIIVGVLKWYADFNQLKQRAEAIASGKLDEKLEFSLTAPSMRAFADTLNTIGDGFEKSVAQAVKSEHFKTELITNISHDLKTPLTSIISYIDLLKTEELENETAKNYINILSERSERLKVLIEDLVEASKAVTGNVQVDLVALRLDELVVQAVGEYTDRLEASSLQVVMSQVDEVTVQADGRHMSRVIENLLSNVCKYAMPNTRVYIEVINVESGHKVIIKNISKVPILVSAEELTKRFVRGEKSRTTEGSGLGLSIADSLMKVQGGKLDIEVDGDLFKVILML